MTKHGWGVTLRCQGAELRRVDILALLAVGRGVFGLDEQPLLEILHGELVPLDDFAGVDLVGGLGSKLLRRLSFTVLD